MPTTEELLKQAYQQASAQNAPASSDTAPAAGAGTGAEQGNTPEAPANGESQTPATGTEGTTPTTPDTSASGKSFWERYQEALRGLGDYKTPTANSQEDYIKQMYDANLAANKSQLESDYNQNLSDLGAEESKLGDIYYEQQRQAQAESDRNRQAFQEYANARGLNSGTGGQAELAQSNQLSANLNALRQSEAEKRAEVERQRVLLGQQYQNAIQKAQADNDLARAKALYEEAVRVDESLSSAAQADADRALQIFNLLNNTALSAASAYAQKNNDLSLYEKLLAGDSTSELEDLYNKAQQITSTGGYYSGGGGGSSGTFKKATSSEITEAQYFLKLIEDAGGINNVDSYVRSNFRNMTPWNGTKIEYKDSGRFAENYQKTVSSGYSDKIYQINSDAGKQLASDLKPGESATTKNGDIWTKNSDGTITVKDRHGTTMWGGSGNTKGQW